MDSLRWGPGRGFICGSTARGRTRAAWHCISLANNLAIFFCRWHVASMNRLMKCCSAAAVAALVLNVPAMGATVTNVFGFTGPEIFPIDQQIALLHVADLDGDGLNDIVVANNLRSKINLLYNQTGHTNRADTLSAR